jgi:hypothetical protein
LKALRESGCAQGKGCGEVELVKEHIEGVD